MSLDLTPPAPALAERLLAELPYEDRLTGVNMHCLQGPTVVDLYSLPATARFIHYDDRDALRDPVSGASIGYVDPTALAWWLDDRFGDTELARAVERAATANPNYLDAADEIGDLLARRVDQCLELTGREPRS